MKATHVLVLAAACAVATIGAAESPLAAFFKNLPEGTDPGTVSRRITDQFLSSRPENYRPAGYHGNDGYGWNRSVQYSVVSLWVNALACARLDGDAARAAKLVKLFDDFLPGRPKNRCCSRPYHVDDTIFGALPYEIYLANRDPRCLEMGNFYADTQWTPPCEGTVKERHAAPKEVQEGYWAKGYTPQTRLWIDDMYMITVLQSQAFRATGERRYIDRAAKEMCLYLDELQLKDGPAKGLFYHAPDVKYVWGRGDGWMAAGMALVLDRLPAESEHRARILEGYHAMMEALLKFQRADGLWGQLIDRPDDPRNWGETSCTAMFTYAFATGVARGWLDAGRYGPAARKAWLALCGKLDAFANVADVCVGTGKKDDLQYYFDRPRVNGDPHGQAPMLWIAGVLLETGAGRIEGLRTPATSKHFEKRIDPETGVVSYALSGGVDENRQSLYFTAKSMTDDGRFLLFDVSPNERRVREARADRKGRNPLAKRPVVKHKAFIDFATDSYIDLPKINGQIPFVDVKDDYMVYCRDQVFYRLDFANPSVEKKLCDFPAELLKDGAKLRYPFTHLTLARDRRKAFLDSCVVGPNNATNYVQGLLELATGRYESWGKTEFYANHGQVNPVRDDLAMVAWECCWETGGAEYKKKTGWYPRMWHAFPDGRRELHPAREKNGASHECWDEDGDGFYWCGSGVWHEDLATGKQERLCPIPGAHATMTRDEKYVVFDESVDGWWRGCKWRVGFWNRETKRCVYAYSTRPELARKTCESRLHPDPHPHFACNEKYVISTANSARGNMELYVTPVDQLVARTTMAAPTGGRTVVVENPLCVARPAETVSVKWADLGLKPGDTAVRVWDVAACAPVAFQDDRRNKALIFSTALAANETREFRVLADASLPQADLSTVCWSQYLPERMDDFAWENDRFGARAYGPIIMEPAPAGQKLVSSGVDIINKCVKYPVLHRWFVERTGEGSYHKDHGEGMDNYKVGPSRGCGGLGARGADGWKRSINWSKAKVIQCGPVRTEFELVYPAWGGFGEETRRVTLDRGQFFAHCVSTFRGKAPEGVLVGPGLDCSKERQHDGVIARDLAQGWIANWEPDNVDGPDTGNVATAILLAPGMGAATTGTDELGCEYLFPASAAKGVDYWAGATWSGAKAVKGAKGWHACVKNFAAGLRVPVKVTIAPAGTSAAVPKVIFDTDMYTDFDDVGAMAVLHALADAGECEILGTVVSTRKAPSTAMVELINRHYGRGGLPIGAPRGLGIGTDTDPGALKNATYKIYAAMAAAHPELKIRTGDDAPDANDVYRRLLAAAPDGSVTIVTVGFTTNMRRLLETRADAVSPLDGRSLVAKKVKAWYAMACRYPDGREYNSGEDGASSRIAFAEWPSPIYFLDFVYGVEVKCGVPASRLGDPSSPVCEVFARGLKAYKEEESGHPSWDEITVLAAVRGWQRYFGVERGTFTIVDEKGSNHWTKDANGNHCLLTVKTPKAEVGRIVDELIVRRPKNAAVVR